MSSCPGSYANGKWAVDNLIANRGKHDITLPASLSPGEYLIRDEILGTSFLAAFDTPWPEPPANRHPHLL